MLCAVRSFNANELLASVTTDRPAVAMGKLNNMYLDVQPPPNALRAGAGINWFRSSVGSPPGTGVKGVPLFGFEGSRSNASDYPLNIFWPCGYTVAGAMAWEGPTSWWGRAHIGLAWLHMRGMPFESDVNPTVVCLNESLCHLGTQLQNSNGVEWARSQLMRTAPSMYEYELDVTVNDNMAGRLIGALVGATGREADGFTHIKYELYKILDGDGQPTEHWPAFAEWAGDRTFVTTVHFDVCMLRCEGFWHMLGFASIACTYCKRHCVHAPMPFWLVASVATAIFWATCCRVCCCGARAKKKPGAVPGAAKKKKKTTKKA